MSAEPSVLTGERTGERYRPWSPVWTLQVHGGISSCLTRIAGTDGHGRLWRLVVLSCRIQKKRSFPGKKTVPKPRTNQEQPSALADAGDSILPPHKNTCTLRRSGHHLRTRTPRTWGLSGVPQSLVHWKTLSRLSWPNKQWQISLYSCSLVAWGRRRIPFFRTPCGGRTVGSGADLEHRFVQIRSADPHCCF